MDKGAVLNIVNLFKDNISQKGIKIDRIILYGSYANNTQRLDSDIDIVYLLNSQTCQDVFPAQTLTKKPYLWLRMH